MLSPSRTTCVMSLSPAAGSGLGQGGWSDTAWRRTQPQAALGQRWRPNGPTSPPPRDPASACAPDRQARARRSCREGGRRSRDHGPRTNSPDASGPHPNPPPPQPRRRPRADDRRQPAGWSAPRPPEGLPDADLAKASTPFLVSRRKRAATTEAEPPLFRCSLCSRFRNGVSQADVDPRLDSGPRRDQMIETLKVSLLTMML